MKFTGGKTTLRDLLLEVNATATLGDNLDITAGTVPGSVTDSTGSVLTTNGKLTLKSDANGTARVGRGPIDGSGVISGNVIVERFYQGQRSWRCVTAPVNTSATIQTQWQEGGEVLNIGDYSNLQPGFGTHITGPNGTYSLGLGFDHNHQNNPSMRYWDQTTKGWLTVPNTKFTSLSAHKAYMLFVRGSRANDLAAATSASTDVTVIRSTGTLNLGDQPSIGLFPKDTPFILSNPYASAFNFHSVDKQNLNGVDAFKLWDPFVGGTNQVGGWVDVFWDGGSYEVNIPSPAPVSPVDLVNGRIESGAAVLLTGGLLGNATVTVKEKDKASQSSLVFRPSRASRPMAVKHNFLRTYLVAKNLDNTLSINDGIYIAYDPANSNELDDWDIIKYPGFSENLSIKRNNRLLSIERRHMLTTDDTVFLNIANMKAKDYSFKFILDGFSANYTAAYIEDTLFHTKTPISLQDTTDYDFTMAAGLAPAGRYRIVFRGTVTLPVSISNIKAAQQNTDIAIDWKVENELNIKAYEIERSADGIHFTKAGTINANNNNLYNWLDENPVDGNNYYRIRSINQSGEFVYSQIVKVTIGKQAPSLSVYPNIVTNGKVQLQLNNMPKGKYNIRLINTTGQMLSTQQINHAGGSVSQTINIGSGVVKGMYQLEVIQPDKTKTTLKVINQ